MDEVIIELRRNWFGPGAISYEAMRNGSRLRHRVPVEVAIQAPSDAKIYTVEGKSLGERKDWSQEAEAESKRLAGVRERVKTARAKSTDAVASVAAAEAKHKAETDTAKKAEAAKAVTAAKADADAAKKELDAANAELEELTSTKE